MILAQLHGAKPEYTGVVAGMSGSPVYVGNKLLGSLSYRIGQFSKEPIAGITPIEQMLEVRDVPLSDHPFEAGEAAASGSVPTKPDDGISAGGMTFQAMETPLVMSGFRPEAISLWQKKMAGTGLEMVAAGGGSGSSKPMPASGPSPDVLKSVMPGSAVSALLVRGDMEISATCTVTYIDPKQLLACGHPILQSGPVSIPMTTAEVVATLASPLNAFKIINTGDPIGAFTEDRDSAIRGVFGEKPHMIPVHITVHGEGHDRQLNIEVLDLPSLTPQALMVSIYDTLLENNQSTADSSYHLTGSVDINGYPPAPVNLWAPAAVISLSAQPEQGGAGYGTVFETDTLGDFTPLHSFGSGIDGAYPVSSLVIDHLGFLYGTTQQGGGSGCGGDGCGMVYEIDPSIPKEYRLHSFAAGPTDGEPRWHLVHGSEQQPLWHHLWRGHGGKRNRL